MSDQTTAGKPVLTQMQIMIRRQAQAAATKQGLDWASLSKEDRQAFRERAREGIRARRAARKARMAE